MLNTFVYIVVLLGVDTISRVVIVASDSCLFPCFSLLRTSATLLRPSFHYRFEFLYFSYITSAHIMFTFFCGNLMSFELFTLGLLTLHPRYLRLLLCLLPLALACFARTLLS